jgi:hypothetical protein
MLDFCIFVQHNLFERGSTQYRACSIIMVCIFELLFSQTYYEDPCGVGCQSVLLVSGYTFVGLECGVTSSRRRMGGGGGFSFVSQKCFKAEDHFLV